MVMNLDSFRETVMTYYSEHKRSFPWRDAPSPYNVFISEVMLQQTQAGRRTIDKFNAFIDRFPDFASLASAPLSDILSLWQGLGYNRRALALKKAAEIIVREHNGVLPTNVEKLDDLPGIGYATACSISAFAFNMPVTFIETNVRTVFIHHFFPGRLDVRDDELKPFVEQSLEGIEPREWYSALMDYGTYLKKTQGNISRRSKHYTKQSRFEGSDRQLRGAILRLLSKKGRCELSDLNELSSGAHEKVERVVDALVREGMIIKHTSFLSIP